MLIALILNKSYSSLQPPLVNNRRSPLTTPRTSTTVATPECAAPSPAWSTTLPWTSAPGRTRSGARSGTSDTPPASAGTTSSGATPSTSRKRTFRWSCRRGGRRTKWGKRIILILTQINIFSIISTSLCVSLKRPRLTAWRDPSSPPGRSCPGC